VFFGSRSTQLNDDQRGSIGLLVRMLFEDLESSNNIFYKIKSVIINEALCIFSYSLVFVFMEE